MAQASTHCCIHWTTNGQLDSSICVWKAIALDCYTNNYAGGSKLRRRGWCYTRADEVIVPMRIGGMSVPGIASKYHSKFIAPGLK